MKKIVALMALVVLVVTGCGKQPDTGTILMDREALKKVVMDWPLYTNPQFRYELRHPKSYEPLLSDKDGLEATVFPTARVLSDTYHGAVHVKGYANWKNNYTLEDYYKNQPFDLFAKGFDKEEVSWKGSNRAVWFKQVKGMLTTSPDQVIDVVAIHGGDRILEVQVFDRDETTIQILNTLYLYGDSMLTDIPNAPPVQNLP